MKCVNCEYEFFSQETLQRKVCPACGKSLTVKEKAVDLWKTPAVEPDAAMQLKAQVATAINTRRVALVLILAVVLFVGSTLVSQMTSIYVADGADTDINTANTLLSAWLLLAAVIMIVGLYFIIVKKKLTML